MKPTAPRIDMPTTAKIGDIIKIKTKIRHPMETGWRKDADGQTIPRNRLTHFTCLFDGDEIMAGEYASGMSQDPYLLFHAKVIRAGTFLFRWEGDHDQRFEESIRLEIDPSKTS